jgi:hypothetical protein
MTLSVRFLIAANSVLPHPSGRTYKADSNGIVDEPMGDTDSIAATYIPRGYPDPDPTGLHQVQRLTVIGATADRPVNNPDRIGWPPSAMYDTTLSKPIFLVARSNPARWVDITGAAA